jgi:1,4-dihydroxy-2-naphthoate octaprenyltransferase
VRDGPARPLEWVIAFVGVASLLIGVNLGNDYFDFRSGADPPLGVGTRPLQRGVLPPRAFLVGSLVALLLGGVCGGIALLSGPPVIFDLGVAGAFLGVFYTAPPLQLGYRGLGEPIVFLCLGPGATLGTYTLVAGHLAWSPAIAAVPLGFAVTGILHANNLRDFAADERSGKRTLAVRLGRRGAAIEFAGLISLAQLSAIALAAFMTPLALVTLLTVPQSIRLARLGLADRPDGRRLMQEAASLNLRLALLISLAAVVSRLALA